MKNLEALAKQIFNECKKEGEPVTMDEALEMAQMEIGASATKTRGSADKPKRKAPPKKVDETKVEIIKALAEAVQLVGTNVAIANPQTEVTFTIGADEYSVKLIKHRVKK